MSWLANSTEQTFTDHYREHPSHSSFSPPQPSERHSLDCPCPALLIAIWATTSPNTSSPPPPSYLTHIPPMPLAGIVAELPSRCSDGRKGRFCSDGGCFSHQITYLLPMQCWTLIMHLVWNIPGEGWEKTSIGIVTNPSRPHAPSQPPSTHQASHRNTESRLTLEYPGARTPVLVPRSKISEGHTESTSTPADYPQYPQLPHGARHSRFKYYREK